MRDPEVDACARDWLRHAREDLDAAATLLRAIGVDPLPESGWLEFGSDGWPDSPSRRLGRAVAYASRVHEGQVRKGTEIPYIAHLLAVAALVLESGGSETEAIAALLHDAAEDQGGLERLADLRARFGDPVAEIVAGCSDTFEIPKPDWRPRKERYVEELRTKPEPILRVSLADKLHNARAVLRDYEAEGDKIFDRFNAGKEDQRWYYGALAGVFEERLAGDWMTAEFTRVVTRLRELWA